MQSMHQHAFVCTKGYFVQKMKGCLFEIQHKKQFCKIKVSLLFLHWQNPDSFRQMAQTVFSEMLLDLISPTHYSSFPQKCLKMSKILQFILPQKSQMKCISNPFPCSFLKKKWPCSIFCHLFTILNTLYEQRNLVFLFFQLFNSSSVNIFLEFLSKFLPLIEVRHLRR